LPNAQYRFKFYFNATHAIYLSGEMGESHPHTWEVILNTMKITDNFVLFNEVEKMCEEFLSQFQNVFINTVQPFTTVNPTLENICIYFKEKIQNMLHEHGWLLLSIELSETPSRSYVISVTDEFEASRSYQGDQSNETMQDIVDRLANEKVNSLLNPVHPTVEEEVLKMEQAIEPETENRSEEKKEIRPRARLFRKH